MNIIRSNYINSPVCT